MFKFLFVAVLILCGVKFISCHFFGDLGIIGLCITAVLVTLILAAAACFIVLIF